jgi:hypothetical protein
VLAATLCQGNPDRNHNLWNIGSTERYIMQLKEGTYGWDVLFTTIKDVDNRGIYGWDVLFTNNKARG